MKEWLRSNVSEYMTRNFTFVTPDDLMDKVEDIFKSSNFHHLPVLDENGKIVGILSKQDYLKLLNHLTIFDRTDIDFQNRKFLKTLTVEDVMTRNPACIHHDSSVESAIQVFLENLFRALPVVEGKVCVGILTPYDIMKSILNSELLEMPD